MKTPQRSIILTLLLGASVAVAAESPADLERRAAEQERQIRQLEVQNQRLRDQIERLEERIAAYEEKADEPAPAAPAPLGIDELAETDEAPATPAAKSEIHIVRAGESLSKIAHQHGTTTAVLAKINGIRNPSLIREGQRLRLPVESHVPSATPSGTDTTVEGTHTVKEGETFFSISRLYGLSVDALQAANPDVNPKALRVGQQLKLAAKKVEEPAPEGSDETSGILTSKPAGLVADKPVIRSIPIDENISFGEFARRHNMEPGKLNALNGLQLEPKTVLATGSRLYVSAQPLE